MATVKEKGFSSLLKYSKDKKDHDTIHYLQKKAQKDLRATVQIHNECRKNYTNNRRLSQIKLKPRKSSRGGAFDWRRDCFICSEECNSKKRKRGDWRLASTLEIREKMLKKCKKRLEVDVEDKWAIDVLASVEDCADFVAAESRYHSNCFVRFNRDKTAEKVENPRSGRKRSKELMEYFMKACDWLEAEVAPHCSFKDRGCHAI